MPDTRRIERGVEVPEVKTKKEHETSFVKAEHRERKQKPRICSGDRTVKDGNNKDITVKCGGKIFVKTIENKGSISIVHGACGICEEIVDVEFTRPDFTTLHTPKCLMGQNITKKEPEIFLSTVIPENQVLWKCVGVLSKNHKNDYPCGATHIDIGGFPY